VEEDNSMIKTKTSVFTLIVAITAIGLLTSAALVSNEVNGQSKVSVPTWIQNVAGFWSNGDVSDDEFVNAMTFLVEEGIMDLPNVVSTAEAQTITSSLEDMNQRLEKIETESTGKITTAPSPAPPSEEDESIQNDVICPASKVQHWNKIIFTYFGTLESDKESPDIIKERTYEIIVQGHPGEIIDLNQLVFDRLTGMGYTGYVPDPNAIKIVDVGYGIICAYDPPPFVPAPKK
jgi:hypothetical protein